MLKDEKKALYLVNKNIPVFSQILLLFSYSISKNPIYVSLFIFPKFIPLLVITSNFSFKTSNEYKNNYFITNELRKLTLFKFIHNTSPTNYLILVVVLFLFELPFIINILWYIFVIKNNNEKRKRIELSKYSKIMFYINSLFYQFILEFLSFILLFLFRNKLSLPKDGVFEDYKHFKILEKNENISLIFLIIIYFINSFFFIIFLLFGFYCHVIINCIFKSNKQTLNIRHTRNFLVFIWFNIIACLHYYEIFLKEKERITFKIFINLLVLISLFYEYFLNVITYEKNNVFSFLIKFIMLYLFQSIILNSFIGLSKMKLTKRESISLFFINIIISCIFYFFLMFVRQERFLRLAGNYLFASLELNKLDKILEVYNFVLDELIKIKQNKQKGDKIIEIYYYHKKKCVNDDCKCKIIDSFPRWNIEINDEYIKKFVLSIGFFMEEILTINELVKNFQHLIFLIDYFNFVKDNQMLSYSLLLTVINKHSKTLTTLEWYELYNLILFFKKYFDKKFIESYHIRVFKIIYDDITERLEFNKNICKYSKEFIQLIEIKMNFENSIKIQFVNNEELNKVESNLNKRDIILKIINKLLQLYKLNKTIQTNLLKSIKVKKNTEFYYIIYLFYNIFFDKIPEEILNSFNYLSLSGESFKSMTIHELSKKFNYLIEKLFKKNANKNHMILHFENGLKIKYINSFLCSILNYKKEQLIGEDFGILFPVSIREKHNKSILRTITIYQNFFMRKNAFLFDTSKHSISCSITGASMPHFDKTLVIIIEIELTENNACYFILDRNFNGLSISHSIEKKFFFNLDILKKTDVELVDIFNLNPHSIKKSLEKTLDLVKKIKKEIKGNNIEFFNNKLYTTNTNYSKMQNQKFILKHNSMKISNLNGFSFDLSLLHDKNKREYYKTEISKTLIIQTVIRTLKKLSDKYYKDINIEDLINNAIRLYRNLISSNKSKKFNRRGSCLSVNLMEETQHNFLSLKCHIKVIYNSPIYIFKFRDLKNKKKEEENIFFKEIPKRALSISKREKRRLLNTNWLFSNSKQTSNNELIKLDITNLKTNTINTNNTNNLSTSNFLESNLNSPTLSNDDDLFKDEQYNNEFNNINPKELTFNKKHKVTKRFYFFKFIGFIMQFICFILTIFIIIYKQDRLKKIDIYGNFYKELSYFRDKISYFFSSILTQSLHFGNYTSMTITDEQMYNYLQLSSDITQYALMSFYDSIIQFDLYTNKNLFRIIFNIFVKTTRTWETKNETSDLITELNYVIYLVNYSIKNFNSSLIKSELDFFLSGQYRQNINKTQNSKFVKVLYFFINNYQGCFIYVLLELNNQISNFFNYYILNSEYIILFSLIFWGIFEFFFFIISQIMSQIFDKYILNLILNLFIHEDINKNFIKNKPENIYMKHKIELYINLIQNFSKENKNLFLKHKKQFLEKYKKYQFNDMNFLTSTNLLFNINNEQSIQNIKSLKYEPLNEKSIISLNATNMNNNSTLNFLGLNQLNQTTENNDIDKNKPKLQKKNKHKSKKSVKVNINNNNNKEKENNIIQSEQLIPLLRKDKTTISYTSQFLLIILFLLAIIICILHILISLLFDKRIKELFLVLNSFTYYFMSIPRTLVILRIVILLQIPIVPDLANFKSTVTQSKIQILDLTARSSFLKYSKTNYFWEQINLPLNNSKTNLSYLCAENDLCLLYLRRDHGYCTEGIVLCYELIIQSYLNIIMDYSAIRNSDNFKRLNKNDIIKFFQNHQFNDLQENVEFVFSQIQSQFYSAYMDDFQWIKKYLENQTLYINFIFLIFETILIISITILMGLYMLGKIKICNEGVNLFYIGFYKDKLNLDIN